MVIDLDKNRKQGLVRGENESLVDFARRVVADYDSNKNNPDDDPTNPDGGGRKLSKKKNYGVGHPYKNKEKATSIERNAIRNYIISQKYVNSGTDAFAFRNKLFIFDHSNEGGTYENLEDGDGFGIRIVQDIGGKSMSEVNKLLNELTTDGKFADNKTIDDVIAKIKSVKDSNYSSSVLSEKRGTKMANVPMASENDGEGNEQSSGVQRSLASGRKDGKGISELKESKKQTESKNFKAWFGDWEKDPEHSSKVVDAEGKPLVVYTGTDLPIYVFDKKRIGTRTDSGYTGKGFYFSNIDNASRYKRGNNGVVEACFLDIKNPLEVTGNFVNESIVWGSKDLNEAKQRAYEWRGFFAKGKYEEFVHKLNKPYLDWINSHDGVHRSGTDRNGLFDEWVVKESTQIKSATDNNGDFSRSNPDIRYSMKVNRTGRPMPVGETPMSEAQKRLTDMRDTVDKMMADQQWITNSLGKERHTANKPKDIKDLVTDLKTLVNERLSKEIAGEMGVRQIQSIIDNAQLKNDLREINELMEKPIQGKIQDAYDRLRGLKYIVPFCNQWLGWRRATLFCPKVWSIEEN